MKKLQRAMDNSYSFPPVAMIRFNKTIIANRHP